MDFLQDAEGIKIELAQNLISKFRFVRRHFNLHIYMLQQNVEQIFLASKNIILNCMIKLFGAPKLMRDKVWGVEYTKFYVFFEKVI